MDINSLLPRLIATVMSLTISKSPVINQPDVSINNNSHCQAQTNFLVVGGGGEPSMNEIALEKNILYFQRTLEKMGYDSRNASFFFANGNNGQATIRYLDKQDKEKFKVPNIPHLKGAATLRNFQNWMSQRGENNDNKPLFFYFTGHGIPNALILWRNQHLSVKKLSRELNKLPSDTPIVTMMAQCFSGSFANFIYEDANPNQSIALQTRCGFFATVESRPSVGCTAEVNEADYKDYSSSFFAGLSGYNRIGQPVASADYNLDGKVSFAEAHAFAKVDEETMDWPISTSEAWLQKRYSPQQDQEIARQPIINFLSQARPEQKYVINSLTQISGFDLQKSYLDNLLELSKFELASMTEVELAYLVRLKMELMNVVVEKNIRASGAQKAIAILDGLLECESSSWQ